MNTKKRIFKKLKRRDVLSNSGWGFQTQGQKVSHRKLRVSDRINIKKKNLKLST